MEIIVVGISSQEEESAELLSWAINVPARPDDTVVALHVLVRKDDKKFDSMEFVRAKIDKANAFTIDLLGAFTDLCQAKQVKVVSKVVLHSSVQKGLIDEVVSLDASFLILGASMYQVGRPTLGVTKYCFQHAPAGCSVITVKGRRVSPRTESFQKALRIDSDSSHEGIHKLELKRRHKEYVGKKLSSLQKRFLSRISFGHGEVTESFHMSKEKLSSKEILQEQISPIEQHIRKNRNIDNDEDADDDAVSSSNSFSKIGIHGETLSDCDLESLSGLNQQNCLSIWRNFNLEFLPNNCLKLLTSSLGRRSVQAAAKYGENSYVPPDANGGDTMPPPILKPSWRCFTFEEIAVATNNFHPDNMVGRGGYAEVYRGNLQDGQIIAVKRLASGSPDEQKEKDFLTELGIIGHVCHPNTASLIGCCIENGLHLIFDFSPHGSLASVLHGTKTQLLEWPVRYKVAVGTARGLHYLHKCCQRRIIHRDIKASNVLLGPDFEPQISDFGLAKWLPRQWTHHSVTPIEGTFGYLAPEYFLHGIVDEKTDVFAFGVLLLEIISGRRPVDASKQNLLIWAKPLLESANIAELADPKLGGQYDVRQMQRMVLTASLCIRQSAIWRPSMSEVLQLLTDGETPEIAECWRMSTYKTDEVDDYWDFDGQESSQRCRIRSLYY